MLVKGTVKKSHNPRWSFEWKNVDRTNSGTSVVYNDIYGILQDATGCIWNDEWQKGASPSYEYMLWGAYPVKTSIVCEEGGTVKTKAGTFEGCMKITLDTTGKLVVENSKITAQNSAIASTSTWYAEVTLKSGLYKSMSSDFVIDLAGEGVLTLGTDGAMTNDSPEIVGKNGISSTQNIIMYDGIVKATETIVSGNVIIPEQYVIEKAFL